MDLCNFLFAQRKNAFEARGQTLTSLKGLGLVGAAGLEPATTCLEGRCSIHLSYAPVLIAQCLEIARRALNDEFTAAPVWVVQCAAVVVHGGGSLAGNDSSPASSTSSSGSSLGSAGSGGLSFSIS